MKKIILVVVAIVVAIALGILIGRSLNPMSGTAAGPSGGAEREVLYWVAPMDADKLRICTPLSAAAPASSWSRK